MAAGGFKLGEAFVSLGAKVNEKSVDTAIGAIGKKISGTINKEMEKIANLGHTTGSKVAVGMQVGFGGYGLNLFGDVQQGLAEVNTLSGLTGSAGQRNMEMLQDGVYNLSREMGVAQKDIIPGMYDAISAGVPQNNIFDFMETANKLAIGGVTDTQTAVDGLTTIVNAFGLEADDVGQVSDQMFTAVKNGKTTVEELSGAMFQVAPLAAEAGIGLDQVNAAMGTLTLSGTPTSVAATQVRSAIQGLLRPSEDMTAIMSDAGYESAQAAIEQEGLAGALQIVSDATGGNQGEMMKLLGSVEAFQASTGILKNDSKEYSRQLDEQQNALGATDDAYSTMEATQNKGLKELKVAWDNFAIVIGEAVAPMFNKLAGVVNKVMDWFSALPKPVQQAVGAFTLLATVLGPPIMMFYKYYKIVKLIKALALAKSVGEAGSAFKGLSKGLTGGVKRMAKMSKAVRSFNALKFGASMKAGAASVASTLSGGFKAAIAGAKSGAIAAFGAMKSAAASSYAFIMAHPFIMIGVAVAAIVTLIIMNWDKVKRWFMAFWNWFKSTFVFEWLVSAFTWVKETALAVWNTIKTATMTAFNAIKAIVVPVFNAIKTVVMTVFNVLKAYFTTMFNVYKAIFTTAFKLIKAVVTTVFKGIRAVVMTVFNFLKAYFTTMFEIYKKLFTTVFNAIKAVVTTVFNAVKSVATTVFNFLKGYFTNVFNAYKTIIVTVWNAISGFVSRTWNGIKQAAARIFNAIRDTISGVWDNIKQATARAWGLIKSYVIDPVTETKDWVVDTFNEIVGFIGGLPSKIAAKASGMWNSIADGFKRMINNVIGWWNRLSFTVPAIDVPGPFNFEGATVGTPDIPYLAKGGAFDPFSPTLAMIGEGSHEEIASPVPTMQKAMRQVLQEQNSGPAIAPGAFVFNIHGDDSDDIAQKVEQAMHNVINEMNAGAGAR